MMCFMNVAVAGLAKRFSRASMMRSSVVAGAYISSTRQPPGL
jgi:hypothetical protein